VPASKATLTPQIIGQAENAHKPLLELALASTGVSFIEWVALKFAATGGEQISRAHLASQMSGALKVGNQPALEAIEGLTASRLLEALPGEDARIRLTAAGQVLYQQIHTAIEDITARVYANIAADDLATAARVLTVITAQANAEAAHSVSRPVTSGRAGS
jgi:DNA-binding MarR family transcriptional regulator